MGKKPFQGRQKLHHLGILNSKANPNTKGLNDTLSIWQNVVSYTKENAKQTKGQAYFVFNKQRNVSFSHLRYKQEVAV